MRLYVGNAKALVGKKVDCHRRMLGAYPLSIVERDGNLYTVDDRGVCSPIPEKEDDFNCYIFDFVVE